MTFGAYPGKKTDSSSVDQQCLFTSQRMSPGNGQDGDEEKLPRKYINQL